MVAGTVIQAVRRTVTTCVHFGGAPPRTPATGHTQARRVPLSERARRMITWRATRRIDACTMTSPAAASRPIRAVASTLPAALRRAAVPRPRTVEAELTERTKPTYVADHTVVLPPEFVAVSRTRRIAPTSADLIV